MNADFQTFDDKKVRSGYKSLLLYNNPLEDTDGLYHILLPLETVPSVVGSVDTFDFDLLTSPTKGKVEGKESLDQKDVEFMWHRDNVARLEALQGVVLNFLVVYGDFSARGFVGTIRVRPNDVSADILKGTFTITPLSADVTTIQDARDLVKSTVYFTSAIPDDAKIGTTALTVPVPCVPADATISVESNANVFEATATKAANGEPAKITISRASGQTGEATGMITIKASKDGYAPWFTTIAVSRDA